MYKQFFIAASIFSASVVVPNNSPAAVKAKLCVFDPSGAAGDAFSIMQDFRAAALGWGVAFELKPYTDEKTAAEDLKAGVCNAAVMTGIRARGFNRFSGTLEAMGGVRSYDELKLILKLLASPKIAKKLRGKDFETVAIFPAGAVYLFVAQRSWDSVSKLAGKRIATMDFDAASIALVERVGAAMVPADVGTFAGMFNNGHVDAAYAPATAFKPLELEKGLRKGGGIIRFPLAQMTFQMVVRTDAGLPPGFAAKARAYAAKRAEKVPEVVARAEQGIPSKYWISVPAALAVENDALFRGVRIALRDKGVFDGTMLSLLRRVRCKTQRNHAECAEKKE